MVVLLFPRELDLKLERTKVSLLLLKIEKNAFLFYRSIRLNVVDDVLQVHYKCSGNVFSDSLF